MGPRVAFLLMLIFGMITKGYIKGALATGALMWLTNLLFPSMLESESYGSIATPSATELEGMVQQVRAVLPQASIATIRNELMHSHYNVEVAIANLLQNPHIMDQGGSPSPAGVNARRRTPQASPGSAAGSPQTSLARSPSRTPVKAEPGSFQDKKNKMYEAHRKKYIAKFGDKLKPGRRIDPVLQSSVGAVVTS